MSAWKLLDREDGRN